MKRPRIRPYLVNYNGKLYVLGGRYSIAGDHKHQSKTMEMYDPEKNFWTILLSVRKSTPFYMFAAAAVHNKHIYFCGGYENDDIVNDKNLT